MLAVLVLAGAGCAPSCDRVCHKVLDCDLRPRLSQLECKESCLRQGGLYEEWEDDDKLEDFAAHRRCIMQATCDELEDGVCYDESLFVY
ncbi:MAG: hypothetical protein JRJ84_04975 [Deltaproteobacteria bacterium]|nr:hypothetical protein [Deltaproteobacteria bacterium]